MSILCNPRQSRTTYHHVPPSHNHLLRLSMDNPRPLQSGCGCPRRALVRFLLGLVACHTASSRCYNPDGQVVRRNPNSAVPWTALQHIQAWIAAIPRSHFLGEPRDRYRRWRWTEKRNCSSDRHLGHRDWDGFSDHHLATMGRWVWHGHPGFLAQRPSNHLSRPASHPQSGCE
jgi:hypothetical protein